MPRRIDAILLLTERFRESLLRNLSFQWRRSRAIKAFKKAVCALPHISGWGVSARIFHFPRICRASDFVEVFQLRSEIVAERRIPTSSHHYFLPQKFH